MIPMCFWMNFTFTLIFDQILQSVKAESKVHGDHNKLLGLLRL